MEYTAKNPENVPPFKRSKSATCNYDWKSVDGSRNCVLCSFALVILFSTFIVPTYYFYIIVNI